MIDILFFMAFCTLLQQYNCLFDFLFCSYFGKCFVAFVSDFSVGFFLVTVSEKSVLVLEVVYLKNPWIWHAGWKRSSR